MTQFELDFLVVNLQHDISRYGATLTNNISNGVYIHKYMLRLYFLTSYMEYFINYNLQDMTFNLIEPSGMKSLLKHTDIILNKQYDYDFE